jgi:TolB-like protein/cytochrome c-type biogenesis protein CcmH/NrfG
MPDVFLSYNREDAAFAKRFADAFVREGFDVWWDQTLRSGETYDEVTEAALRGAKAVVVLWSPRSVASHWVRAEATIGHRAKTLVPATIEPCDKPVMFELTQTADLSHWQGEPGDPAWQAFLSDVRRKVGCAVPAVELNVPETLPTTSCSDPGVPYVGVLPFTFRGDEGELEILAEDVTENVTGALAENDYFKVIATGRMVAWRGRAPDYEEISRELGARYLVEGKLQRSSDTIRLAVRLIGTESANAAWSRRFAASAEEIADNSDEFPRIVASELAEQVMQAETRRAMTRPSPYTAWEHVLRSMAFMNVMETDSKHRILDEARAAVAVAPEFGLAQATLANAIVGPFVDGALKLNDELRKDIRQHVTHALRLDGDNSAVICLITRAIMTIGELETCLRLARRAVELRPHSPRCHSSLAGAYMAHGRIGEAIAAYNDQLQCKGFDASRCYSLWAFGWCHLLNGNPTQAEEAFEQSLTLNPNFHAAITLKAIAEAQLGKEKAAIASIRHLRDIDPHMSFDRHISYFTVNPRLGRRMAEHIATLRKLWAATGEDG